MPCCCPGSSTRMCTSASRATPSGRASPPPPGRPRPAGSRPWSTCRWTACPATVSVDALAAKRRSGRRPCRVDVGFWGGVVPGNLGAARAAPRGRRARLQVLPGRLRRPRLPAGDAGQMDACAGASCAGSGSPLLVHAESARGGGGHRRGERPRLRRLPGLAPARRGEPRRAAGHRGGPGDRRTRAHRPSVQLRRAADDRLGAPARACRLTAETCPHYLALTAEEIADGATAFKCSPPVREAANRELLWGGLRGRGPRPGRLGPLAVHGGDEGARQRGLRRGLGRHLLAAARAAGDLDPGPPPGVLARARSVAWMARRRPARRPDRARAGSRPATTRTSASSPRRRPSSSTRPGCTTGTR